MWKPLAISLCFGTSLLAGSLTAVAATPFLVAQAVPFNIQLAYDGFLSDIKELEDDAKAGKSGDAMDERIRFVEAHYRENAEQIAQHPQYSAALSRFAPYWVQLVSSYGKEALKNAEFGYKNNKPGFFLGNSGVTFTLNYAKEILDAYTSFRGPGDAEGEKQRKAYQQYQAKIQAIGAKFWEKLAANEKTPPDLYAGGDKAELKAAVLKAWHDLYPKDQIVAVRFPMASWDRKRRTEYNGAISEWQSYDTSYLQARLVAKESPKFHRLFTVHLYRNNQSGKLTVSPDTKQNEAFPHRLLTARFKP